MTAPEVALEHIWHSLAGPRHPEVLERLLHRHGEAHRRYHTVAHVQWVLHHVGIILTHLAPATAAELDVPAIQLAVLFHDAVYDPRSDCNERQSAALATEAAECLGWPPERVRRVEQLVMATATHRPSSLAEALVVDADLSILGAPANTYLGYVRAVRDEYGHLTDDEWRRGRQVVLERLLAASPLFTTDYMQQHFEHQARTNLTHELDRLHQ